MALDQITFDRSEEISDAMHEQEGLSRALVAMLAAHLPPDTELVVFALIAAMEHCRNRARHIADEIARSDA